MTTALLIYLVGFVALAVALAVRTPDQDVRLCILLSVAWPLSILILLTLSLLWSINWDFDIADNNNVKMFQIRKPVDGNPGIAITLFHLELQFWKKRNYEL